MPHLPSVLIVAQLTPPGAQWASTRVAAFAKHLGRMGHRVAVLTSSLSGEGAIPGATTVVRTPDLLASPLNWRRANFDALASGDGGGTYAPPSRVASWVIPDVPAASWLPFALPAALRLAGRFRPDCVITTAPPHSTHLVGAALRRRGIAWVADLRDGWGFDRLGPASRPAAIERCDEWLERRTLRAADLVTAVTDAIAADLRDRVGAEAITLPNGFDRDENPTAGVAPPDVLRADRHSLVYTGRFSLGERSPGPILDGLRRLRSRDPGLADRLEVVIAGPLTTEEQDELRAPDLAGGVRSVGTLDRPSSRALQRAADSLLVLVPETRHDATGKLYEYLAAERPILVIGERSEAARIVTELDAGLVANADDPDAIASAFARLVAGDVQPADREAAGRYDYAQIAARLSRSLVRLCADRAPAGPRTA